MLKADLGELQRTGRARVEETVPPDAALWEDTHVRLSEPLEVELELRRLGSHVGSDVIARGTLRGKETLPCRRCLTDVEVEIDESVEFLFRSGVTEEQAKAEEVYPLPEEDRYLDVSGPVREHILLTAPRFAVCRPDCKGLCPECGARLNETTCECDTTELDERWAPLRELKSDEGDE